jgi:WhiB family redox-sensing transcriptional regulator
MTIASLESIRNTERWTEDALCAQVDVGDVFFPNHGESPAEAKRICHNCEVKAQCLAWALEHNEVGVWGEKTERERKALKRDQPSSTVRDIRFCVNNHNRDEVGVTGSGYCRQCARDREQRYKTRIKQGLVQPLPHGTRSRYQLGCHCVLCVAANSEYMRRRRGRPLSLTPGAGL